jgi:hypothetical protein
LSSRGGNVVWRTKGRPFAALWISCWTIFVA